MADALYLAKAITKYAALSSPSHTLSSHVKAFEEDMFVRATRMQDMTYNMMRLILFEHNAPQATVAPWLCWIADPTFSSVVVPFCLCGYMAIVGTLVCETGSGGRQKNTSDYNSQLGEAPIAPLSKNTISVVLV